MEPPALAAVLAFSGLALSCCREPVLSGECRSAGSREGGAIGAAPRAPRRAGQGSEGAGQPLPELRRPAAPRGRALPPGSASSRSQRRPFLLAGAVPGSKLLLQRVFMRGVRGYLRLSPLLLNWELGNSYESVM